MRSRFKRRRIRNWLLATGGIALLGGAVAVVLSPNEEERVQARIEQQLSDRFEAILPRAEAGEPAAQYAIGEHFQKGLGVERDPAQAMTWYRKAADQAHAGAQYAVGTLYEKGDGVRQDFIKAAAWYELAANMGDHPGAEFALGRLFYRGRGVANDPSETVKWTGRAAAKGHPAAQYLMGQIYETGWGVDPDPAQAYKWYILASRKPAEVRRADPDFDPGAAREALASKMTRFDRERGEEWARDWNPTATVAARLPEGTTLVSGLAEAKPVEAAARPSRRGFRVLSLDAPLGDDKSETVTVSLIVELQDPALAPTVCAMAPRIRDAVFAELWSHPVPQVGGRPDLKSVGSRLLDPVNQGLGQPVAKSTYLHKGDRPLAGNEVLQTPYDAVEDCHAAIGQAAP